ncbi:MAG: hypothetical protein QM813_21615 [Verrucomicrobiota bacterium]
MIPISRHGAGGGIGFQMRGVKQSVARVFRVEGDGIQTARKPAGIVVTAEDGLEIQVRCERAGVFVEDVEIAIEVSDKETSAGQRCISGLGSDVRGAG